MPIFANHLGRLDYSDPQKSVKAIADHLRSLQEQLEYTLLNLDSSNITEIDTNATKVVSASGSANLEGDRITMEGKNGEKFSVGMEGDRFTFTVNGKNGQQAVYMTSDGELVITKHTTLSIDCGEW